MTNRNFTESIKFAVAVKVFEAAGAFIDQKDLGFWEFKPMYFPGVELRHKNLTNLCINIVVFHIDRIKEYQQCKR